MTETRRVLSVLANTTDAAEALRLVLSHGAPGGEPWKPLPYGANPRTVEQTRWSREETDAWILSMLHQHAAAITVLGDFIVPVGADG